MQSRFLALFAGLAVVAVSLAVVAVSSSSSPFPVATLSVARGLPMLAVDGEGQEVELVPSGMLRRGPEAWSSNPQMQMLTCFGICGPECEAHCEDNYQQCVRNDPSQLQYHKIHPHFTIEPETSRPNWCRANLDRCKGQCA